jgi:hypothetical protein
VMRDRVPFSCCLMHCKCLVGVEACPSSARCVVPLLSEIRWPSANAPRVRQHCIHLCVKKGNMAQICMCEYESKLAQRYTCPYVYTQACTTGHHTSIRDLMRTHACLSLHLCVSSYDASPWCAHACICVFASMGLRPAIGASSMTKTVPGSQVRVRKWEHSPQRRYVCVYLPMCTFEYSTALRWRRVAVPQAKAQDESHRRGSKRRPNARQRR